MANESAWEKPIHLDTSPIAFAARHPPERRCSRDSFLKAASPHDKAEYYCHRKHPLAEWTLCELNKRLPKDLDAAVFVVMHIRTESLLPEILTHCGDLPAVIAARPAFTSSRHAMGLPLCRILRKLSHPMYRRTR